MNLVPLGRFQLPDSDAGAALPSLGSQRSLLDTLRGRALPAPKSNASAIERTGAIAMGAALAGAARANGWSDTATIAVGVGVAAYALSSDQPTLLCVAQGVLAPAIERWAASTFTQQQQTPAVQPVPLARMPQPTATA